jgi:N-acetylmuramoyl-L-alanine amidase
MANARAMRRRLVKEAVEENYATMFGAPAPSVSRRRRWRRLRRGFVWVGALGGAVGLAFVLGSLGLGRSAPAAAERVIVQVTPTPTPVAGRAASALASFDAGSATPLDRSVLPFSVRRVVIDAGHGGEHSGTTSATGVQEKEITLDLAERLATLLNANGFVASLTRTEDSTISLTDRGDLANAARGDVFISIHVNWFSEPEVRAVETFYLGPAEDEELQRLAARENLDSEIPLGEFRKALERVYADVRREESRRLARSVQQGLLKSLQTINPWVEDRGVKSAPFGVLIRTDMPAILAEVGCLSNEEEAQLLESPAYREYLAEALFEGIRSYALELNPNLTLGS